jgi:selenocysteine lyase/cysteine desulfurase
MDYPKIISDYKKRKSTKGVYFLASPYSLTNPTSVARVVTLVLRIARSKAMIGAIIYAPKKGCVLPEKYINDLIRMLHQKVNAIPNFKFHIDTSQGYQVPILCFDCTNMALPEDFEFEKRKVRK